MKSETVKITSGASDGDVVLVMKRRRFPWWILLLLLPLVLLIPISREIKLQFVEADTNTPVAGQPASVRYPTVSTFGTRTPISVSRPTDTEGKVVITGISEPLWYRIFGSDKDTLHASVASVCGSGGASVRYSDVPRDRFMVIPVKGGAGELVIKVIDTSTGEPLTGASVVVSGALNKETVTSGDATLALTLPLCSDIAAKASKEGYTSDSLSIKGFAPGGNRGERTLRLTPIQKPEPPKPDPPKKVDPPKPDPPKKADPPKQDDLKGKTGDLRFNLQWYCKADLDMIIKDPCGKLTYYDAKRTSCNGSTGILDIDANQDATNHPERASTSPQENTVWTNPSDGKYTVIIKCCPFHKRMYLQSNKVKFTLTIVDRNGRIDKTGQIGENDSLIFYTHTLKP